MKILLLRSTITGEQIATLRREIPYVAFDIFGSNPADYREHAANCERLRPDLVVLPTEKTVPSLAMERGFAHVAISPEGVQKLVRVVPEFVPFTPEGATKV